MITTVAFDADETLVDTPAAVRAGLEAVMAHLATPGLTVEELRRDAAHAWKTIPEHPVREIRTMAFRGTLERFGLLSELEPTVDLFFEARFAHSRPYPGVLAALEQLRPVYQLGYATNGNSFTDRCGLAGQFTFEVYALQSGVPKKPDVRFYEAVAGVASAKPEEIVYVGDSYEHDVVGPAGYGMRTVWINRKGVPVPSQIQPDAVIDNVVDLPRILARWR